MSKLFVDANLLMELMFARSKMERVSELLHDPAHEYFISVLTVHILYYFAEIEGISRDFVSDLADLCGHLMLSPQAVALARRRYGGKDFEDCLQAACAELGGCEEILTLDKNFRRDSGTLLKVTTVA